jgi:GT2 family glycosyltransferase
MRVIHVSRDIQVSDIELSIIIVNWHSAHYTYKCIQSLLTEVHGVHYEIIVIDGASYDGCGEMLQKHFPKVHFIQSLHNEGFARANNRAYAFARGAYILFLNPDTEIIGSAIHTLLAHLKTLPQAGAVGCKLLNADRTIQTSCIQSMPTILNQMLDAEYLRARFPRSRLWGMSALSMDQEQPEKVEGISGACIMVERSVFEEVGLFSTDYFMYAEDMDLCYKIRQAGYKNYYIPDATVMHFGGESTKHAPSHFSSWLMRESIWRFLKKTRGDLYAMSYRFSMFVSALLRLVVITSVLAIQKVFQVESSMLHAFRKWLVILQWSVGLQKRRH